MKRTREGQGSDRAVVLDTASSVETEAKTARETRNGAYARSDTGLSKKKVEDGKRKKPITVPPSDAPPAIQHFSDDSDSGGPSTEARKSAPHRKRARTSTEYPEQNWRKAALAIIAQGPSESASGLAGKGASKRSFAVVCSSNVNRSIMAQILLEEHDMRAKSYGTGSQVKLPGKDPKSPQAFAFGTPYLEIHDTLMRLDEALFRRNSVLGLLERDAATKRAPERWQALESVQVASFDVVVCFESRVFDLVVEDLQHRDPDTFKPLHIVSMTIRDSAEDSAAAAGDVLELCKMLEDCADLDAEASKLLHDFRMRTKRTVLHQVCHI